MPVGYQHSEQGPVAANYAKMLSAAQRSRRSAWCWPPRRYSRPEVTGRWCLGAAGTTTASQIDSLGGGRSAAKRPFEVGAFGHAGTAALESGSSRPVRASKSRGSLDTGEGGEGRW